MSRTRGLSLYEIALAYLAAGRSGVPIAPGCKGPSIVNSRTGRSTLISWERYQYTHASPAEVRCWFARPSPIGVGLVAGALSGLTLADGRRAGLEFLDFDDAEVHARFVVLVADCGAGALLERLPCEATPRGGRHYGYLCVEWAVSTTLARRRAGTTPDGRSRMVALIESRGGRSVRGGTHPGGGPPRSPGAGVSHGAQGLDSDPSHQPVARRLLWACARPG